MHAHLNFVAGLSLDAGKLPVVCLIPGGPGLSSLTLGDPVAHALAQDSVWIDPPGTAGLPALTSIHYADVVAAIEHELASLGRALTLVGHSFGGFYAVSLADRGRLDIRSWVGVSTPITTIGGYMANATRGKTPAMGEAEVAFLAEPSEESFRAWFASMAPLYFGEKRQAAGAELLTQDPLSFPAFAQIFAEFGGMSFDFLGALKGLSCPLTLVSGSEDRLFTPALAIEEARALGCQHHLIRDAGHFVGFDQPRALGQILDAL